MCAAIEEVDGCNFRQDAWTRPSGGGGITRVLQVRLLCWAGRGWVEGTMHVGIAWIGSVAAVYRPCPEPHISSLRNVHLALLPPRHRRRRATCGRRRAWL